MERKTKTRENEWRTKEWAETKRMTHSDPSVFGGVRISVHVWPRYVSDATDLSQGKYVELWP